MALYLDTAPLPGAQSGWAVNLMQNYLRGMICEELSRNLCPI